MALLRYLREFHLTSVLLRLTLAVLFGGVIGSGREHRRRPAGFRTYMMVCLGAALTMVLGQYQYAMLGTVWKKEQDAVGMMADVTRLGAQVINGIGFLGTGTILVTERREVKGLTTAAGLWASACVGLAIGAGFYEGVLLGFLAILLSIEAFPRVETFLLAHSRNMNLCVELTDMEQLQDLTAQMKSMGIQIRDVELERRGRGKNTERVSVLLSLHLPRHQSHDKVLARLAGCPDVRVIHEV